MTPVVKRIVSMLACAAFIGGCVLVVLGSIGSTTTTNALGGRHTTLGNAPLFVLGLVVVIVAVSTLVIIWGRVLVRRADTRGHPQIGTATSLKGKGVHPCSPCRAPDYPVLGSL